MLSKQNCIFRGGPGLANLKRKLGKYGFKYLEFTLDGITRLLPHSHVTPWIIKKCQGISKAKYKDKTLRELNLSLFLKINSENFFLTAQMSKKKGVGAGDIQRSIDDTEKNICTHILTRISSTLRGDQSTSSHDSISAIRSLFDEQIVASYLENHLKLQMDLSFLLSSLRELSEQSYENRSLTFGCLIDSNQRGGKGSGDFPGQFKSRKKLKALSDGFRTAYRLSKQGELLKFEDLWVKEILGHKNHFYPEWCQYLAQESRNGNLGICLTQQGDILIFDTSSLKFSYRFGRWQYWNHSHIVSLLTDRARAKHVKPKVIGEVVRFLYRAALDVSFRRSGGLIGLIGSKNCLKYSVLAGDRIGNVQRGKLETDLDHAIGEKSIYEMSRRVFVELIGLDGATIVSNTGQLLAYGAVLQPKKRGKIVPEEGSRTKAAIGFSHYGIAIKISSDGDMNFYDNGKSFLTI